MSWSDLLKGAASEIVKAATNYRDPEKYSELLELLSSEERFDKLVSDMEDDLESNNENARYFWQGIHAGLMAQKQEAENNGWTESYEIYTEVMEDINRAHKYVYRKHGESPVTN